MAVGGNESRCFWSLPISRLTTSETHSAAEADAGHGEPHKVAYCPGRSSVALNAGLRIGSA